MRARRTGRLLVGLAFVACAHAVALAAPSPVSPAPKADDVTTMSPYEVVALGAEFAGWSKTGSRHFIVYSDAGSKVVARLLRELEIRRWTMERFWGRPFPASDPWIVVLPTARSDWKKLESHADVEWRVAVSNAGAQIAPLFVVHYDWQDSGLDVLHGGLAAAQLRPLGLGSAVWFEWGVKNFFETVDVGATEVKLGRPNTRRVADVVRRGWLPWPRYFAVTTTSPEFTRAREIAVFEGQSAAFMQFLLTRREPEWRERLMTWRARSGPGATPDEAAFIETFGENLVAWQRRMEAHVKDNSFHATTFPIPAELSDVAPVNFDVRTREMRELFVLVQVINQPGPKSDLSLDRLGAAAGLRTDGLRPLLSAALLDRGRVAEAREALRTLVDAGSTHPSIALAAARLTFFGVVEKISPAARLDGNAAAEVRRLARRALEQESTLGEAMELIAWTHALGRDCGAADTQAITALWRGQPAGTAREGMLAALAIALTRSGATDDARALLRSLADVKLGPETRRLLDEVGQGLATGD